MSATTTQRSRGPVITRNHINLVARASLPAALLAVIVFFAIAAPGFLSIGNVRSLLVDHFVVLGFVAGAMTLVVIAGGIDLSLGTAADMASLAFAQALLAGFGFAASLAAALAAALLVGCLNALLIGIVGIAPFLATLGTLFIGQSVQQLASGGGQTIYLMNLQLPAAIGFVAHGAPLGVPMPIWLVGICLGGLGLLSERTVFGQRIAALGLQRSTARLSGLPVRRDTALVYVVAAGCCAITGVLLSCTVKSYAPGAGSAYVLDAVGATFIGTTLSSGHRPTIIGTALGVLLLSVVADGLVLIGWSFEWQQVASGLFVLAILAISFGTNRSRP